MDNTITKLSPLTEATFYVLLAVQKPIHGYGIIKTIEELTEGRIVLAAGTLYGALQNLERYKCIELHKSSVSRRKKEYVSTSLGSKLLQFEISRLKSMLNHAQELERDL